MVNFIGALKWGTCGVRMASTYWTLLDGGEGGVHGVSESSTMVNFIGALKWGGDGCLAGFMR